MIAVQCAWSPWLNADSPDSTPADLGDLETIDVLKQKYGLCPTITEVEVGGMHQDMLLGQFLGLVCSLTAQGVLCINVHFDEMF